MTLTGLTLLRNKHDNKHLTKYIAKLLSFLILTGVTTPFPVVAFQSTLPLSISEILIMPERYEGPDYSRRLANTIATHQRIEVEIAKWPKKKSIALVNTATNEPIERIYPTLENPFILEGEASFYSRAGCLGCSANLTMANGQSLDDNALTMAIGANQKHLVGRTAKVTNLVTGKSTSVRITDTGGFYSERYGRRVADLTIATKKAIGMQGGVGQVRVEVY